MQNEYILDHELGELIYINDVILRELNYANKTLKNDSNEADITARNLFPKGISNGIIKYIIKYK